MRHLIDELLNQDYIYIEEIKDGETKVQFYIEEKKPLGKGKSFFTSDTDVLIIRAKDQAPIVWALKNKKCSEAAFLIQRDGKIELSLLEMKSNLRLQDWKSVLEQFKGMYLSSLAILSILKLTDPVNVKAYIAYKEDKVTELRDDQDPMIFNKLLIGENKELSKEEKSRRYLKQLWLDEVVDLPHDLQAKLIKGQRISNLSSNDEYNCDFGSI
ncbi:MAG: hypothetical protein Q4E77_01030 [Conchiformibius sp.]|nr:hypothetical protein [Conchiformibius sp.]